MKKRQRNPRVIAVETLRAIKKLTGHQITIWTYLGRGTVAATAEEREQGSTSFRPRRPDEYAENNPEYWASLWRVAGEIVAQADTLRAHAEQEYHAAKQRLESAEEAKP